MPRQLAVLGNIVLKGKVLSGHILIEGQKIAKVAKGFDVPRGIDQRIDCCGRYILPGRIEVHGHMREPGMSEKETYETGTQAAVAGGVTTFLDMPNTIPPTTTIELLEEKLGLVNDRSFCDFGFIFGGTRDNQDELQKLSNDIIAGVKFFTAGHETTPTTVSDLGCLYRSFEILAQKDIIALVHAENQSLIDCLAERMKAQGRSDGEAYSQARGEVVVGTAVWEVVSLARELGTKLYLCHLSTPGEVEALRWAKSAGIEVFGEAVSYHLMLNTTYYQQLGSLLKVSPAIRSPQQQQRLWRALREDIIDTICSEHTPHLLSEKRLGIWDAASGMPGIQETLPLLITAFMQKFDELSTEEQLVRIANLTSTSIARLFNLPGKGAIEVGNDADLVVVDLESEWVISKDDLLSKCGWSAYEGWRLMGRPEMTMIRGEIVFKENSVVGNPHGKWVHG
ncbi:MAG: dihydroorotase family protein [Candidatus Hodarchaeota archaeon]